MSPDIPKYPLQGGDKKKKKKSLVVNKEFTLRVTFRVTAKSIDLWVTATSRL